MKYNNFINRINRKSINMFCIVFLCLAILTGAVIGIAYVRSTEKEMADYAEILDNEANKTFSHMVQPVSSGIDSCNSVFNSKWYKHYQNVAGIYDHDFTALRRDDIYRELQSLAGGLSLVDDILVVMPEKDYIISTKCGWLTTDMYRLVYNTIGVDSSAGYDQLPVITVNDPEYCALVLPDPTIRKYKSVVAMLIPKASFQKELLRYLGENAVWVKAELDGEIIFDTSESAPGNCVVLDRSDAGARLNMTIGYRNYYDSVGKDSRTLYLMMFFIALAVSAFVSLFITILFIRPMNQMVRNLGGQVQDLDNPYRFIYDYVDRFSRNQEQLNEENTELQKSHKRLLSMLRNEIVSNILTSENINFQEDYIKSSFPWLTQSGHFVIAACQNTFSGQNSMKLTAADLCSECENSGFAYIGQELWMLLQFEDEEKLRRGREELKEKMKKMPSLVSAAFSDPAEAHGIYLEMREALKELGEQWLHLPILTQSRLVSLARTNKRDELCQIISEIHSLDSVFWLFLRLSWESGMDHMPIVERYHQVQDTGTREELVKLLQEYAVSLCAHISARKPAGSSDNSDEIIRYIDENFRDEMLSVNYLADQFGIHRTLISKMVKAATGDTFSDYLTNLRMAEAEKLLREGVRPITAVGEKVGIPNYSTFKRSFQKAFGASPKEWLENQ